MFSNMIQLLKRGELPSAVELQIRLKPAVIKKIGVLQQPQPCWSNDTKINPDADQMLWAAILLKDLELISIATALLFVEQGNKLDILTPEKARALLIEKGADLLALAPTPKFKWTLAKIINRAVDGIDRE